MIRKYIILILLVFIACSMGGSDSTEPTRALNSVEQDYWTLLLMCMSQPYIDVEGIARNGVVSDINGVSEPVISLEPTCSNSETACHNSGIISLINPGQTSLLHEMTHYILELFTGDGDRWHTSDYFDYVRQNRVKDFKGLDQRLCIDKLT